MKGRNIQVKNFREKWARFSAYWQTEWYELSHGVTETDRKLRRDAILLFIGGFLIVSGVGSLHKQEAQRQRQIETTQLYHYSAVKSSPTVGMNYIQRLIDNHSTFSVVLIGSKCPDCHKIARSFVPKLKRAKAHGRIIVVLDLDQMSNKQLKQLEKLVPDAHYRGSFYMPSVTKLGHAQGRTELIRYTNSTKVSDLMQAIYAKPGVEP